MNSHTSFLLNWFNSSCIDIIQSSSLSVSSIDRFYLRHKSSMLTKQVQRMSSSYSLFYVSNDVFHREIPWCSPFLGNKVMFWWGSFLRVIAHHLFTPLRIFPWAPYIIVKTNNFPSFWGLDSSNTTWKDSLIF